MSNRTKNKDGKSRATLSDSQLKSEIMQLFNSGKSGKTDLYGIIRTKYTLGRDRYFKAYDLCYTEWSTLKQQAQGEVIIQVEKQAQQLGLKSKLEKQLHLQKQIDDIQVELDAGISPESAIIGGRVTAFNKKMSPQDKAILRRTMKELYAELNKMEGDYAPAKIANTDSDGNDIQMLDYSKMSIEELQTLKSFHDKYSPKH